MYGGGSDAEQLYWKRCPHSLPQNNRQENRVSQPQDSLADFLSINFAPRDRWSNGGVVARMFIDPNRDHQKERFPDPGVLSDGAAVDDDDLAIHETVPVADHEGGVLGELGGSAETAL